MPSTRDLWPDKWLRAYHLAGKRPTVAGETVTVADANPPSGGRK